MHSLANLFPAREINKELRKTVRGNGLWKKRELN